MNKPIAMILITACHLSYASQMTQDFFQFDRKQIRAQIHEIAEQDARLGSQALSPKDFERVILFLQGPTRYFRSVRKVADIFPYVERYDLYLSETRGLGWDIIARVLDERFRTIDEERVPILGYLLVTCARDGYGEVLSLAYPDRFASNPQAFVGYYRRKSDWRQELKSIINHILPQDLDSMKGTLQKLGESEFEMKFKTYADECISEKFRRLGILK